MNPSVSSRKYTAQLKPMYNAIEKLCLIPLKKHVLLYFSAKALERDS